MQNELPPSSSMALLWGGSSAWEGQQSAQRAAPSSYLCTDKVAGGKGHFLMGCCRQEIWLVLLGLLVPNLSLWSVQLQMSGQAGVPGWGGQHQVTVDVQLLHNHTPLEQGTALESPKPFLAQGTKSTGDIFPPTFPYISFFTNSVFQKV